ncbi:MAG: murein biosynthesis integral membrane protein MurJ [Deltaproteobacteria bacterium]|nr:murein biosynthesis integral membrane protein MurJ [Deltaproteobacteria bacterium]
MKTSREKIVRATVLIAILELLTAGAGLLKQMFIAAQFGTSETTDAYVAAMTVIALIQLWFSLPIRQVILPMFRYDLAQQGEREAWANISILVNNLTLALLLVAAAGWYFAPTLVSLMTPGFEQSTNELAVELIRIMLISIILISVSEVFEQILFSYERFLLPGSTDLVNNSTTVLTLLVLGSAYGIYGLAIAVIVGAACEFFSQLPILWEKRKLYRWKVDWRHPGMREVGRLSFPLLFANSSTEIARITDRIFASLLPAGSLSALSFGSRITGIFSDLLIDPLQKSTFPHFTKLSAEGNFSALSRQLSLYFRMMLFFTLPTAIGMMVTAEPIVRVLYQRGAFDETSVRLTSQSLACYALGFPAAALGRVLTRTFISLKDTWTPTKTSLLRVGLKIFLSWVLIHPFAHMGLALAESLSQIVRTAFLFFLLPDQVKGQESWNTIKSLGKILVTGLLMGVAVYFVKERITGLLSVYMELAALVLCGVVIYAVLAFVRKGEEMQPLIKALASLKVKYFPQKS